MRRLPSSSCLSWGFFTKEGATFSPVDPMTKALTAQSRDAPPRKPEEYIFKCSNAPGETMYFCQKKNLFDEQSLIPVSWRRNQDLILIRLKEGKGQIKSFSSEFVFADWKTFETLKCSPVESLTEIKLKDLQKCECSSSKLFHF